MRKTLLYLILPFALCTSCKVNKRQYYQNSVVPETITMQRFDNALLAVDTADISASIRSLYAQFPDFMSVYVEEVLGVPAYDTAYLEILLPDFLSDTMVMNVNAKEQEVFADVSALELETGRAFGCLKTFYPDLETPHVYLFVSGFNNSFLMNDNTIAIGTDLYLGKDYPYYEQLVYNYMRYTMRPECIPVDIVSAYLFRHFTFNMAQNRLLENMIYRGRMMYFLSVLFPKEKPSEIMGYTPEQWQWCIDNERAIWTTILDNKDLFKADGLTLTKYLNDAPFTAPISDMSPGRLGTWVGWRISESYMENNKSVTMQEFLAEPDAAKIMELSKYKP